MNNMIIIIGLGNPGKKFEHTRHNVGFMAVDAFAKINNFPEFKLSKKFSSLISEEIIAEQKILLAKPQTFMNESGKAVRVITKPYTINPKPLLVIIHDDIDLPVGKIKIIKERGSAGHKGVESIIKSIGNDGLIRFRIGISPYSKPDLEQIKAKNVVLKKFSKEEQKSIDKTIQNTVDALNLYIIEGIDKTMNEYNK